MHDRRISKRYAVSISAIAIDPVSGSQKFGTIIDLSDEGAQFTTRRAYDISESFLLHENLHDNIYECVVCWTKGDTLGFRFVDICGRKKRRRLLRAAVGDLVPQK